MRGGAVRGIVFTPLPIECRLADLLAFPPRLVVRGARHVREDRIVVDHVECVLVGLLVGAGHDAEIAGFRVDCAQAARVVEVQPGYVITQRPDLPAGHRVRRNQHREIGMSSMCSASHPSVRAW
jgi:hypothetical protein